jgi:hypothetical protein
MSDLLTISPYFTEQQSDNQVIRDLLKGLKGVRSSGKLHNVGGTKNASYYLPQFPEEPDTIYTQRVMRSYLTNYFLRAIQSDSGKVLASPVSVQHGDSSLPDEYSQWLEDIDLEGMPLDVFTSKQLQSAQAKGVSLAYVDFLTEERRPFVHEIDIDDVLAFKTNSRTGRLDYLRWKSSIVKDSEDEIVQIGNCNIVFEITPTTWAIYDEEDLDVPIDTGEIIRYRDGNSRITEEIPVSLFYTNKTGVLLADSPYRALAEMTIEHYQVSSDIKNMMFYALQPLLFAQGMPEGFEVSALASYIMVVAPDGYDKTDIKWVQVDSGSIEQAREQVADIESRISSFGIDANGVRPSGNQTATARAIDSAGSNAALNMFAKGLQEHVERIVNIMSTYTLKEIAPTVTITPDFNIADNSEKTKDAISAFEKGLISAKAATDVMIQNNALPEGYDFEIDQARIQNELATSGIL